MDHSKQEAGSNAPRRGVSRRDFLTTTALAAAGLKVAPLAWAASSDRSADINSAKGETK
jgi:ferric-dicitrate binding protein FerR (iron transport regulator)